MTSERDYQAIPRVEEQLEVSVHEEITGRVRVSTTTETFEEVVRQDLRGIRADVVRIPIDRVLNSGETPPEPRTEGDVMIIPIFEEVVVAEKRLVLKEELRITQTTSLERIEVPVELRRQRVSIERLPTDQAEPDAEGQDR